MQTYIHFVSFELPVIIYFILKAYRYRRAHEAYNRPFALRGHVTVFMKMKVM